MADPSVTDEFDAIRPYRDAEVTAVLSRLVREPELLAAVARLRLPRLSTWWPSLASALTQRGIARHLRDIRTVSAFQQFLEDYFERLVRDTTDGFSYDGTEHLQRERGHLFVGNHRDIAMDSAFMNYALYLQGLETSRIAVGDNLLKRSYATDLMRLNKSFVVRRNVTGVKEMAAAYQLTSRYLHHSIQEQQSVWIAQREGRAKDGCDRTDPAIIKMFHMSQRKTGRTFGEVMAGLHIVPVAVSYEVDPCDALKAKELYVIEHHGKYEKPEDEDLQAIVRGITGYKGRVHFSFGTVLGAEFADADAVAAEIDRQVIGAFKLWPTHLWAAERLGVDTSGLGEHAPPNARAIEQLQSTLALMPPEQQPLLLQQYANPIVAKREMLATSRG